MRRLLALVFVSVICWLILTGRTPWSKLRHPPGVIVPGEPMQTLCPPAELPPLHGMKLTALADYEITARILGSRRYRYERGSDLVPIDIAVGWGRMSDQAVLDRLSISQSLRFFFYEWRGAPPIPPEEIIRSASNMHIIPASREIEHSAFSLRSGSIVRFSGKLVNALAPDGFHWNTSLSRTDTGKGACELFYVTHIAVQ